MFFFLFFFLYIHNYTEYNQQWNFDLHSTHPSTHTPGAVFTQEKLQHDHTCNFIQDSLVWNTLNYINIYYRTIISPINI